MLSNIAKLYIKYNALVYVINFILIIMSNQGKLFSQNDFISFFDRSLYTVFRFSMCKYLNTVKEYKYHRSQVISQVLFLKMNILKGIYNQVLQDSMFFS